MSFGPRSTIRLAGTGLLVVAAAIAVSGSGPLAATARPVAATGGDVASTSVQFTISGKVGGLYPGASRPLPLHVVNGTSHPITVTSISTTVSNASSSCAAGYLHVSPFSGHVAINPYHSANVTVHATLSHTAPNACQGVTFPLHYAGLGTVP